MVRQGNIAKIDHLMSADRDMPYPDAGTKLRYLICSTPRCGSNLVCDFLHSTMLAGDPLEYLNRRFIAGYLRSKKFDANCRIDLNRYLGIMERRRTSSNGYFGIKMHFEHLQSIFANDLSKSSDFLARFDQVVVLRRRDKIAQSVSLHRARVTQLWTSEDKRFLSSDELRGLREVEFHPEAIAKALQDIIVQEQAWDRILKQSGKSFEIIWHEDFISDPIATKSTLLRMLGLPLDAKYLNLASRVSRQSHDNDSLLESWRQFIGCTYQESVNEQ